MIDWNAFRLYCWWILTLLMLSLCTTLISRQNDFSLQSKRLSKPTGICFANLQYAPIRLYCRSLRIHKYLSTCPLSSARKPLQTSYVDSLNILENKLICDIDDHHSNKKSLGKDWLKPVYFDHMVKPILVNPKCSLMQSPPKACGSTLTNRPDQ